MSPDLPFIALPVAIFVAWDVPPVLQITASCLFCTAGIVPGHPPAFQSTIPLLSLVQLLCHDLLPAQCGSGPVLLCGVVVPANQNAARAQSLWAVCAARSDLAVDAAQDACDKRPFSRIYPLIEIAVGAGVICRGAVGRRQVEVAIFSGFVG